MNTVLITGGSSGIGLALCREFLKDNWRVLIVSKPEQEIAKAKSDLESSFKNAEIETLALDLTKKDSPSEVYNWVNKQNIFPDVLINNAGIATYGFIDDIPWQDELIMIELNIIALYKMTRLFLRDMIQQNAGQIINISSVSAFQPNPTLTTYGATKSFVMNFSRGLQYELQQKGSKVKVLTVCPTPVKTGFQKASGMENSSLFESWMTVTAEEVARDTMKAMKKGRGFIVPKQRFHVLNKLTSRLPSKWLMAISANELKEKI